MALLAVGAHQGFLAADPEKVSQASQASGGSASPTRITCQPQFSEDDTGRIPGHADSVALDLGDIEDGMKEKTEKSRERSFRLPPSLKARVAVRRKPVITWRPYTRQPGTSQDATVSFPEGVTPQFPDDVKVDLPKDLTCPGCFEDECAFMWRTIEDDSDSVNTNSGVDDDAGDYLLYSPHYSNPHTPQPYHYTLHPFLNTPVTQNSSQCILHQSQYIPAPTYTSAFSHYHDPHHSALSSPSRPPRVLIEDFGPPWDPRSQPRLLVRMMGPKRARYKTKCRTRCMACSMPLLPVLRRATTSRPSLPGLVRSLSESSVFTEAVKRLSEQQQLKSVGSKQSPQSPQLKRQQLSLPIASLSKPALNGRKGHRNSPSPETQ